MITCERCGLERDPSELTCKRCELFATLPEYWEGSDGLMHKRNPRQHYANLHGPRVAWRLTVSPGSRAATIDRPLDLPDGLLEVVSLARFNAVCRALERSRQALADARAELEEFRVDR